MLTLNQVSALSEDEARKTLECVLWPNGPVCPHCGAVEKLTRLQGKAHRTGVFQCNNCHDQFTITVNTIFEDPISRCGNGSWHSRYCARRRKGYQRFSFNGSLN